MSNFPGTAGWFKENEMPYRDSSNAEYEISRLNRKLTLAEEKIDELSRRRRWGGVPQKQHDEVVRRLEAVEIECQEMKKLADETAASASERCYELEQERDELVKELLDAGALRAHAIATEIVSAYLTDPNWLPNSTAVAALDSKSLAEQVLALQREREAISNALHDADKIDLDGNNARDMVQLLVGPTRHTFILPLRHAVAAIRATVDCWAQNSLEKVNELKEKTK